MLSLRQYSTEFQLHKSPYTDPYKILPRRCIHTDRLGDCGGYPGFDGGSKVSRVGEIIGYVVFHRLPDFVHIRIDPLVMLPPGADFYKGYFVHGPSVGVVQFI